MLLFKIEDKSFSKVYNSAIYNFFNTFINIYENDFEIWPRYIEILILI